MNDDELIMALREQRGRVAMTTPVEQIISRGRAVRARRRIPAVAATVGAAAAVAVAVAPWADHPAASHPTSSPGVQLAAWTVTRQADGGIQVTIRQAYDPAGLQRVLRADGVPASVTFTAKENPACRAYPVPRKVSADPLNKVTPINRRIPPQDILVIYPAALPSGTGLRIMIYPASRSEVYLAGGKPEWVNTFMTGVNLVYASPQCTGS